MVRRGRAGKSSDSAPLGRGNGVETDSKGKGNGKRKRSPTAEAEAGSGSNTKKPRRRSKSNGSQQIGNVPPIRNRGEGVTNKRKPAIRVRVGGPIRKSHPITIGKRRGRTVSQVEAGYTGDVSEDEELRLRQAGDANRRGSSTDSRYMRRRRERLLAQSSTRLVPIRQNSETYGTSATPAPRIPVQTNTSDSYIGSATNSIRSGPITSRISRAAVLRRQVLASEIKRGDKNVDSFYRGGIQGQYQSQVRAWLDRHEADIRTYFNRKEGVSVRSSERNRNMEAAHDNNVFNTAGGYFQRCPYCGFTDGYDCTCPFLSSASRKEGTAPHPIDNSGGRSSGETDAKMEQSMGRFDESRYENSERSRTTTNDAAARMVCDFPQESRSDGRNERKSPENFLRQTETRSTFPTSQILPKLVGSIPVSRRLVEELKVMEKDFSDSLQADGITLPEYPSGPVPGEEDFIERKEEKDSFSNDDFASRVDGLEVTPLDQVKRTPECMKCSENSFNCCWWLDPCCCVRGKEQVEKSRTEQEKLESEIGEDGLTDKERASFYSVTGFFPSTGYIKSTFRFYLISIYIFTKKKRQENIQGIEPGTSEKEFIPPHL